MNINHHFRTVTLDSHPFFTETMYCFAAIKPSMGQFSDDVENPVDWKNPLSVYWTEQQLADFRPNMGTFEFNKLVYDEMIGEHIKTEKRIKRSPHYGVERKRDCDYRIKEFESQHVTLVKIVLTYK
jgi:hypothetical protein